MHPNGRLLCEASSQALQAIGSLDSEPDDTDVASDELEGREHSLFFGI